MKQNKSKANSINAKNISAMTLGFHIALIAKLKRKLIDTYMAPLEICRTEWQALFWINHLGDCSQKELLKNLDIDAAHLARVLEKLEKKNYITRAPMPNNRRCVLIYLTEHCRENIIPQIMLAIEKEEQVIFRNISEKDKTYLQQYLAQIENSLEQELYNL